MRIVNMFTLREQALVGAAQILTDSLPLGWPTSEDAMAEIRERLVPENTLLAALEGEQVIGWGGILPEYRGRVFELHPLVVRADSRRQGVGTAIVRSLEDAARSRGGITMRLGADDDVGNGETCLANVDLYDDLPTHLRNFDPGTHQTGFYLRLGYKIIGVMPDANGIGRPDIWMGKRL